MKGTDEIFPTQTASHVDYGIPARDYIAIQTMVGFCANPQLTDCSSDEIADYAYKQADEMLKRSEW